MTLCVCAVRFWHACVDLKGVANEDMLPPLTEQPGNRESVSQYSEEGTSGSSLIIASLPPPSINSPNSRYARQKMRMIGGAKDSV